MRVLEPTNSDALLQVKYIILLRPSTLMSSMILLLRPFISLKAARKLRQVRPQSSHTACNSKPTSVWLRVRAYHTGKGFLQLIFPALWLGVGLGRAQTYNIVGFLRRWKAWTRLRQRREVRSAERSWAKPSLQKSRLLRVHQSLGPGHQGRRLANWSWGLSNDRKLSDSNCCAMRAYAVA